MTSIEKALGRLEESGGEKNGLFKSGDEMLPTGSDTQAESPAGKKRTRKSVYKLNLGELEHAGIITPNSHRTNVFEEYRILKRPVLMNAFGGGAAPIENGNLVMAASASPGEGKTFTAVNLAMSMAIELDTTVLLLDADVIRRTMTHMFNLQNEPGLIDVLLDKKKDLSEVIIPTDIDKLRLMPAGRTHPNSTELLSSSQMKKLALDLAKRYPDRVVLFDAPPLLAATEGRALADLAGQILIVVEAGKTTQNAIKEVVSSLDKNKAIGMVLNKSTHMFKRDYYYGAYGDGN